MFSEISFVATFIYQLDFTCLLSHFSVTHLILSLASSSTLLIFFSFVSVSIHSTFKNLFVTFCFSMGNLQSNASSSTQTTGKKNDVFLNFRGADTRDGFTNYLYEALRRKSIETFMDEVGIEKGEEIWPKLAKTISDSLIFVAIFSKEYASSKWCLRELVEIMKSGQTVIPVFYKVTVHDVRHQEGSFKDGFDRLEKEFQENLEKEQVDPADVEKRKQEFDEEKRNWRQTLKAACDLKGWPYENGPELKVIDEIVKDIWEKLMRAYKLSSCDFEGLFGFEERFKKVMSLLSLDNTDIRIIGIWGMGGIGKTTLADAIFHQIYDEFRKCFIQNVRQRLEQCGGSVSVLQQEVISKVLNDQDIKLDGVTLSQHIKERLCRKKVFIVLDNVDNFLKLEKLVGGLDRLSPGSRIIITTRNKDILHNCQVNDDYIYEVERLSDEEAQKLFCKYAFRQSPLTEDLMALSHEILWAISGNPLGLKVAGSSLLRLNKLKWQSALNRLKKSSEILEVLQISYDGLEEEDRLAFLDIACFFVGRHEEYVAEMLDNSRSLEVLSDRSLITISDDKIIKMHDLLQEMGREIVRKEDLNNPSNRSRLWTPEVVLDTLKNGYGTNAIRGIFLNMSQMNEEHLNSQAFEKMTNLMILKIYDSPFIYKAGSNLYISKVHFPDGISYLSYKLKSLNWFGYPLKTLPSDFNPAYLIELDLRYSNIEVLWEKSTRAPKLKWIFLMSCPRLVTVSSLLDAQGLKQIDIEYCRSFRGFTSWDRFPSLTYLHLDRCNKLTRILHLDAPSLEEIYIQYCDNFLGFTSRARFPSLTYLYLQGCPQLTQISDHLDAPSLKKIDIQRCDSFLGFTPHDHFPSLTYLCLKGCNKLTQISDHLDAPSLEKIDIQHCNSFLGFTSHDRFPSLKYLRLEGCNKFTQISDHLDAPSLEEMDIQRCNSFLGFTSRDRFPSLTYLHLKGCDQLTQISGHLDAPLLEQIYIEGCDQLTQISGHLDAPLLEQITIQGCDQLTQISGHLDAPLLGQIYIEGCDQLTQISGHLDAPSLEEIDIQRCNSFLGFTSRDRFPSLTYLHLNDCHQLTQISDHLDAPSLEVMDVCGCSALLEFSSPVDRVFNNLRRVRVTCCENLQSFGKNIHFPSLVSVDLSWCDSLTELADFLDAPSIEMITLDGCSSLRQFPRPSQHFNNLHRLDLRFCKDLRSFPSDSHFPSLTDLCFSGCINLEMLYMSNTTIHEVPSTIDSSICKLKALEWPVLNDCSALKCFPEILDTMGSLKNLNLDGTKIKGLPHSIENLSGLETLTLCECENLEVIPTGIYNLKSLRSLDLSGCSKLENLPGNLVTDLSNCGEPATTRPPSWRLDGCQVNFANCLKLDKTAVINIIELQINQHRDMTTKGCGTQAVNLRYLYPGSEVLGWFNRQTNGSSINIEIDPDGVNGHLIGFASCAVFEGCYSYFDIGYRHRCHCKNLSDWKDNTIALSCRNETSTEHVALWYSNAPVLQLCGQCTNYLFEFRLFKYSSPFNSRVKYCGVCPIYEKHNITLPSIADETCGATIMSAKERGKIRKLSDEAETSGRSNEDVIEPNPKRTCS